MNRLSFLIVLLILTTLASCGIYSFKDVSIDPSIKTIKIGFIENRARIVNPQLSPLLTDKIQQKINQQTKLTRTNNDDAHLIISGYISDYSVSTAGISSQQAASNRLTVSVHLTLINNIENKTIEFDVSRGFDFSANLSIEQAQAGLQDEILRNLTDEIFNKIFSNW
jgi:hypothetical protein